MTDDQLRALAKAAKAAAKRERSGEWVDHNAEEELGRVVSTKGAVVADFIYPETRRYIVAACPDVVQELVAEVLTRRAATAPPVEPRPCEIMPDGTPDPRSVPETGEVERLRGMLQAIANRDDTPFALMHWIKVRLEAPTPEASRAT